MIVNILNHVLTMKTANGCEVQIMWKREYGKPGAYEITAKSPTRPAPEVFRHETDTHQAVRTAFLIAHNLDVYGYERERDQWIIPF